MLLPFKNNNIYPKLDVKFIFEAAPRDEDKDLHKTHSETDEKERKIVNSKLFTYIFKFTMIRDQLFLLDDAFISFQFMDTLRFLV